MADYLGEVVAPTAPEAALPIYRRRRQDMAQETPEAKEVRELVAEWAAAMTLLSGLCARDKARLTWMSE
jgi:hypothetical protein